METNNRQFSKTHFSEPLDLNLGPNKNCVESSRVCKAAWRHSLGKGCLNKTSNDKLKLYSHLRALSARKLLPPLDPEASKLKSDPDHYVESDWDCENLEDVAKPDNFSETSPVLIEDFRQPPIQDTPPQMFTIEGFFDYLETDNWGNGISLRVIGGQLLQVLLKALYKMERNRMMNIHVLHANLNNRQKSDDKKLEVPKKSPSDVKRASPQLSDLTSRKKRSSIKPRKMSTSAQQTKKSVDDNLSRELRRQNAYRPTFYESSKQWQYETMVVQLIFYEKPDLSNIPLILDQRHSGNDSPRYIPMPREVIRPPYALQKIKMSNVRLPADENTDYSQYAEQLRKIVDSQKYDNRTQSPKNASKTNHQSPTQKTNETKARIKSVDIPNNPSIEWMSGDAVLVKSPATESLGPAAIDKDQPSQTSRLAVALSRSASKEDKTCLATSASILPTEREHKELVMQFGISTESLPEDKTDYKQLNLSRQEFYVTSNYLPRDENRQSSADKLHKINHQRLKIRSQMERRALLAVQEKRSLHLHERFKCFNSFKKTRLPPLTGRAQRERLQRGTAWDTYMREQESIEMDTALVNKLEKDVLTRVLDLNQSNVTRQSPGQCENDSSHATKTDLQWKTVISVGQSDDCRTELHGRTEDSDENINTNALTAHGISHTQTFQYNPAFQGRAPDRSVQSRISFGAMIKESKRMELTPYFLKMLTKMRKHFSRNYDTFKFTSVGDMPNSYQFSALEEPSGVWEMYPYRGSDPADQSLKPDWSTLSHLEAEMRKTAKKGMPLQTLKPDLPSMSHLGLETRKSDQKYLEEQGQKTTYDRELQGRERLPQGQKYIYDMELQGQERLPQGQSSIYNMAFQKLFAKHQMMHSNEMKISLQRYADLVHAEYEKMKAIMLAARKEKKKRLKLAKTAQKENTTQQADSASSEMTSSGAIDSDTYDLFSEDDVEDRLPDKTDMICTCNECQLHNRRYGNLLPREEFMPKNGYPLHLGRLARHFNFLEQGEDWPPEPQVFDWPAEDPDVGGKRSHFTKRSTADIGSRLLHMLDAIMIRKEILSSSLGHTYVTVTFTKWKENYEQNDLQSTSCV